MHTTARTLRSVARAVLPLAVLTTTFAATAGATEAATPSGGPSVKTSTAESRNLKRFTMDKIIATAEPLAPPTPRAASPATAGRPQHPGGLQKSIPPAEPKTSVSGKSAKAAPAASSSQSATLAGDRTLAAQNGLWTGAHNANPNRQIGKLYFYVPAKKKWSHCTGTAVNSENRSTIVTAGHCVYDPDPDQNGVVDGNGTWFSNFVFCPGYEHGCKLGHWEYRNVATTRSWHSGTAGRVDMNDDFAVLVMKPNATGRLVDVVGGHGIAFNQPVGVPRHAFGYPAPDRRWPQYTYSGEDLAYCPSTDRMSSAGIVEIVCTMTGGSSGGPWLSFVNNGWGGYINSVNSHGDLQRGDVMRGPYFGEAESELFQHWRAR